MACEAGHQSVVAALIARKARLNLKTAYGHTALRVAVDHGHVDIVRKLLSAGALPNVPAKDGSAPLLAAVRSKHLNADLVELLLQHGADPTLQVRFFFFGQMKSIQQIYFFFFFGVRCSQDRTGLSALGWTQAQRHFDLLKMLGKYQDTRQESPPPDEGANQKKNING